MANDSRKKNVYEYSRGYSSLEKRNVDKVPARFRILKIFFILIACLIGWRLFVLQILAHKHYSAIASGQHDISQALEPERGEIFFRDGKTGKLYPLAVNQNFYNIYVEPNRIEDPHSAAYQLSSILEMDEYEIVKRLSKKDDPYEPLKKKVSEEVYEKVMSLNLQGVGAEKISYRYYPEKNVGGQILGFVGVNDDGSYSGRYGLEGYFEEKLKGERGFIKSERDALGRLLFTGDFDLVEARNGSDIILTLDRNIQFFVCEKLKEAVEWHQADGGTVIVMEPSTGAILAMCSVPDFDPNKYNEVEDISVFNNPAIFYQYEPGSIFKAITMAAGLDLGKINPDTVYNDTGSVTIGGHTITNSDNKSYGWQTMTNILEKSLNTGAVFVARKIGVKDLLKYIENFNFGSISGIELQKEVAGDVSSLRKKGEIYLATASFGQGISVTPLQIVSAFAAIANGGVLMKPYIVDEIGTRESGEMLKTESKEIRRVISQRTSNLLSAMLVSVVEKGHGKRAGVPGYYIAGKTGTAQVPTKGGYEKDVTIGSFAGFGPADNPRFAMIVKIDNPKDVQWAESSAAPLFGKIATFLLQYFEVPTER